MTLDRRQALRTLAFGSIGAVAAPAWAETLAEIARGHADHAHTAVAAAAEAAPWAPKVFDAHQNDTVVVLSELIIPQTDTPGAKAAKVNEFVDLVLDDASESDRKQFLKGLAWMDARSQELFGTDFVSAAPEQQTALLDLIAWRKNQSPELNAGIQFFAFCRRMVADAYYTTPIGFKEVGFMGNGAVSQFSVPKEALEYAMKRSGLG